MTYLEGKTAMQLSTAVARSAADVVIVGMMSCTDALAQYNTPNTEPVTQDDCQIIAQVLGTQTCYPLSFASFGAACDWHMMNLAVQTTDAMQGWRVFFRRPKYDARSEHVIVSYSDSYDGINGSFGFHEFNCRLDKHGGRWQITGCSASAIAS